MSKLETKYPVFESIEQMLAPESLSGLLSHPITRVDCQPMNGHRGLAGGQLSYVDTDVCRLVLKRMSLESDWIMFASEDTQCRAVRLWEYGLLDQLRPHLEHKIVACSRDQDGWAILMDDLTGYFYAWDNPLPPKLVPVFLDRLARFHAKFWSDPLLNDARLGLCDPGRLLDQTSLAMAQRHNNQSMGVLPEWIRGGWEAMEGLLDSDVFTQMRTLIENPRPLFDVLGGYPVTLLHGDYRAENLAHPGLPVLIDWQEASYSIMTIDLAWFTKEDYIGNVMGKEQATGYYRKQLEAYLKAGFTDAEWQAMIDLGTLVDALRSTCFTAYWTIHADTPEGRLRNEMAVKQRNQQVRDGIRWL